MTVIAEDNLTAPTGRTVPADRVEDVAAIHSSEGSGAVEPGSEVLIEEDLLVEDVSIDGMCGVY